MTRDFKFKIHGKGPVFMLKLILFKLLFHDAFLDEGMHYQTLVTWNLVRICELSRSFRFKTNAINFFKVRPPAKNRRLGSELLCSLMTRRLPAVRLRQKNKQRGNRARKVIPPRIPLLPGVVVRVRKLRAAPILCIGDAHFRSPPARRIAKDCGTQR